MSEASEQLAEMTRGCEYYADAYCGEDAPFPDRMPDREQLCRQLQEMSRLAHRVLHEHAEMEKAREALQEMADLSSHCYTAVIGASEALRRIEYVCRKALAPTDD